MVWIFLGVLAAWLIFGSLAGLAEFLFWGVVIIVLVAAGAALVRYFNNKNRV